MKVLIKLKKKQTSKDYVIDKFFYSVNSLEFTTAAKSNIEKIHDELTRLKQKIDALPDQTNFFYNVWKKISKTI